MRAAQDFTIGIVLRPRKGFPQNLGGGYSTPIKSRLTIMDSGRPAWGIQAKPLLVLQMGLTRCSNAWTGRCNGGLPRRHMEITCGSSRRQWWADVPVNDGLFVRRDA
jgi:hypothetical protein